MVLGSRGRSGLRAALQRVLRSGANTERPVLIVPFAAVASCVRSAGVLRREGGGERSGPFGAWRSRLARRRRRGRYGVGAHGRSPLGPRAVRAWARLRAAGGGDGTIVLPTTGQLPLHLEHERRPASETRFQRRSCANGAPPASGPRARACALATQAFTHSAAVLSRAGVSVLSSCLNLSSNGSSGGRPPPTRRTTGRSANLSTS